MFCNNCGKEIPDGELFCQHCGASVDQEVITEVIDNDPIPPKKPKKKIGKKFWISVVAVILVLAISVGLAFAHPVSRNFITKLFMSPEKYFEHCLTSNAENLTENIYESINKFKSVNPEEGGAKGNLKIEFGEGFKDVINEYAGSEAEYITWIDSISADFDVASSKKGVSGDITYKVNDSEVTTIEMDADLENYVIYYRLPDINDKALRVDLGEIYEQIGMDEFFEAFSEMSEEVDKFYALIPEQEVTKDMFVRYAKIIAKEIEDVEEDSEKIEIEGVEQKCTVLTAEIDDDVLLKMLEGILEEAKDDEDIEKIIKDYLNAYNLDEDYYNKFADGIDELLSELPDELDGNVSFDLKLYVDNRGDVIGIGVDVQGVEISFIEIEKGNKTASELKIDGQGVKLSLVGTEEENNGKSNGNYALKFNSNTLIKIKTSNVDVAKANEGVFIGNMTIEAGEGLANLLNMAGGMSRNDLPIDILKTLKIEISATETSGKISIHANNKMFISISAEGITNDNKQLSFPSSYADVTSESDMLSWVSGCSFDRLFENIKHIGLPSNLMTAIEQGYAASQQPAPETPVIVEDVILEIPSANAPILNPYE